jgi:hypothetical protein
LFDFLISLWLRLVDYDWLFASMQAIVARRAHEKFLHFAFAATSDDDGDGIVNQIRFIAQYLADGRRVRIVGDDVNLESNFRFV